MSAVVDGFINIDIAVADFKIKTAFRISTDPGFILNGSALAAKIGKRNQITDFALLTFGEIIGRFQLKPPPCLQCLSLMKYTTKAKY
jgi:hypothetical protein